MTEVTLFDTLETIHLRPKPFSVYTAKELWTDEYTSAQMLTYHLNGDIDVSSWNSALIDRAVKWIIERFSIGSGTQIADFGCGPGLYTTRLAHAGASVTGIDFSERSIEYARKTSIEEGLSIEYVCQNYLEYQSDTRFDLIIMIMCDFCALSPDQRNTLLNIFQRHLTPGGSVLLDVHSLAAFDQRTEASICEKNQLNGFWSPNPYYGFVNSFKYDDEKVTLDKYTIIEADRIRTVYNWLQHFSADTLTQEFEDHGFQVEGLYSNIAGDPFDPEAGEIAIIGSKIGV